MDIISLTGSPQLNVAVVCAAEYFSTRKIPGDGEFVGGRTASIVRVVPANFPLFNLPDSFRAG